MIATKSRILVVDDNAANRELLEALLQPHGYEIALAASGDECIDYVTNNDVDLVMLDVMMPGMDGFEVASALRAHPKTNTLPIIMITALSDTHHRINGIESGCDAFISKPFDHNEVLARTRSAIRMSDMRNRRITETSAEINAMRLQLEAARRVQEALYPTAIPDIEGFDVWGGNISSLEVSGDYYDIITGSESHGRALFTIADVSGKGAPAAMLASSLHAGLHSQALDTRFDLVTATETLNHVVALHSPGSIFATMIIGELSSDGVIRYVRAGHEFPCIVHTDGSVELPTAGGGLLGIDIGMHYQTEEIVIRPGDVFCVYTDGVTDVEDAEGTPFGMDRFQRVLSQNRNATAERIGAAVIRAINEFTTERIDDITLVVIRRIATRP